MTSTNDGKDVKSYQTSGPKGKSYYIELYKFLEARLNEGSDGHERTKHLCVAWHSVHSLCKHSAPSTHTHLLYWLQRHTARAVLQTEWQTPKRKDDRKSLEDAIDVFISQVAEASRDSGSLPWEAQLVARGEWFKRVLDNPWDHPVLTLLLNPTGTPPTDDEVLTWLKQERGVTFVVRLHTLVGEKCDDIAVSLAAAVMERARAALPPVADSEEQTEAPPVEKAAPTFADKLKEEAGFTPDVWETLMDIEFVLLHKRDSSRCIALAKQTPLLDAYPLIERLQKRLEVSPREKRLWKNAREVAILIAQVVIARCMVVKSCVGAARTALYCCARLLARLLTSRLPAAADALGAQALTARHLHTLAQAVDKQLSSTNEDMKPYVCELYVRAITAGMNELERLKLKTEKEAEARSMEKSLASWFVQLGVVLSRSDRIACECILTAFSLHPSQKMYERIDAAPPLAPVLADFNESKEATVKSEFGSWANDSRSQTNLVKTSETLNMKQSKNQANVLSTAIFNEGEALGLSPELCQDIAVLLSGPRVKTLSWDMDRTLLLENCRAYCEVTHEGTRVLTRELKYLNIDPRQYQHLPEEKDDDENDPYYGIERGYEHLAILEEPEEIWEDANDPDNTESASSIEKYYLAPRRKKKTKKVPINSDEDSDPLSLMAEEKKRIQKKKERPHSKERSKERKKKPDLIDPLDIDGSNQNKKQTKPKKEPKEKKERKKKEKVPKVIGGKRSALAKLIGLKVGKTKKKSIDVTRVATSVTVSDNNSQCKNSLTSLKSEGNYSNAIYEESIPGVEGKCQESKPDSGMMKNQCRVTYHMIGNKCTPSHILGRPPNNLTGMQYRPPTPSTDHRPSQSNRPMNFNHKSYPDDVRANLSKLLEFRRQREELQREQTTTQQKNVPYTPLRKPAINRPNIPLQSNISPKSVAIPEIPKSYINKEQAEKLAELIRVQNKAISKESVIQYASKTEFNKKRPVNSSLDSRSRGQHLSANSIKITDIVNPSYDRLMAEIAEKQSQEVKKSVYSQYQPVHSQKPLQHSQKPVQRSLNVMTPGQKNFHNFLKEYDQNNYMANTHAIDMTSKFAKGVKNPVMPVSRVVPVIPSVPKPKPEPKPQLQSPKPPMQKKPEPSLNTFSRLSYHKNKQNEMKNKIQSPKLSTYQEVSSELDEIIKEHQLAQMKVIQSKRDNVDRLKPATVQQLGNKCDTYRTSQPLLCNLLQNSASTSNSLFYQNESPFKSNPVQQKSPVPQKTSLSEKDSNDLMNLLRQQSKLNNSPQRYSTNVTSKPSTSTINKAPPVTYYNATFEKPPSQYTKSFTSSLETKIINVISNTLLKPGHHDINNSISVNIKSNSNSSTTKSVNCTDAQNIVKKNETYKDHLEKKYIPESSKPEWQAVMCDLLRYKTPTRGPNALDVALNKSTFESAFEKSVKETSTSQSRPVMEKNTVTIKYNEKANHPKPVIASIQNVIITKKGIKLKNEVPKQHKDPSAVPINYSKQTTNVMNEKLQVQNTFETTKKLSQGVQRKQFTYAGPKHVDPFISGIPNSDYDLLEELMDDDLRKEIGELSSDDESYNAAAQSFLKPTRSNEKRVSVQFNKGFSEPVSKPATDMRCLYKHQSSNEISQSVTPKTMSQCANKIAQSTHERNSLKVQEKAANKTLDANSSMASTSHSVPTQISTSNAQNVAYNSVKTITNRQMMEPNIYISGAPQPAPLQSVVLVGQELVYGGYSSIQTPIHSVNNLVTNDFVAVNSTPTMTLYQTTQYTTPVVIGTSITVPVMNVSCVAIPVQPSVVEHAVQPSAAVTVEPETLLADTQVNMKTCDSPTEINKRDWITDCSQPNKLQKKNKVNETDCSQPNNLQEENKANETDCSQPNKLQEENKVNETDCSQPNNLQEENKANETDCSQPNKLQEENEASETDCSQPNKLQDKNKANERKVLSEVQGFAVSHNVDKTQKQKTENNTNVNKKGTVADMERLKKKRLAIINREIYHKCREDTIPLTYSPLPIKIETVVEKHDFPKAIPLIDTILSVKEDKSDSEEEKLLTQIKNNLQDLSDAINEIPSPATPDSNDSKENKSYSPVLCRRILLRSSNKITPKPNAEGVTSETPQLKKSKAMSKSRVSDVATKACVKANHDKTDEKESSAPMRASKRLRNKKNAVVTHDIVTNEKKPLQHQRQTPNTKAKPSSTSKAKSKMQKKTVTESLEYLDIETELQGSRISKLVIENKNNMENDGSKLIGYEDTSILAGKVNENIILKASKPRETSVLKQSTQTLPADIENKDKIPETSTQNSSLSEESSQKAAILADKAKKGMIRDASILNISISEQSLQKTAIPADKTNEDVIPKASMPQKTGISEQLSQKIVDDQHIPETVEVINIYEKCVPEHMTDYTIKCVAEKVGDLSIPESIKDIKTDEKYILEQRTNQKIDAESNLLVNSMDENTSNKVFSASHADGNSEDINKGINTLCANISKPSCDKLEKNVTTTNNDVSKLLLDEKDSAEIETVSVPSTEVLTTNDDLKRTAEKCDTLYNKTINDENKSNIKEKDNIDLDMTVTCEEVPKQKLSPTFGNIKTARRKPINADKKEGEVSKYVFITNDDNNIVNKNTNKKETSVAASNGIEMSNKTELCVENVNVDPTPKTWLLNNTPKIWPEPEVTSSPHSEIPTAENTAADIDDDVVIIDDDAITKPVVSLREHGNGKVFVDKHVNNETPALGKAASTSHAEDETSVVKHGKNEATSSNVLSHRSDKAQIETNTVANPNLGTVNELSVVPQHIKDNIHIEHLPCNDPMKNRVRVSLPNGRKLIATVCAKVHVTYDTLFTHPSFKNALLNETNCKKPYFVNVHQIVTVDKTDPNKILSAKIDEILNPATTAVSFKPFETIDLLSDDEDSGSPKLNDASKQVFVTKYGNFAAPPMTKDLLIRHQNKFNQKTQILLKKVDAKPDSQVKRIDSKPNTKVKKIQPKPNKQMETVDAKPGSPKKIAQSAISPIIPNQYVAELINDIENKFASKESNAPIVIPEVVEIDDSSNDSLYQGKSAETITEDNKIINDLKNVLLKELGVEVQNEKTKTAANLLQVEPHNDDDLEIVEEIHPPKNSNRRKVLKISAIPTGKSFPFDDLDEEDRLQITKRKCAIKLVRCDDQKYDADVLTQSSGQVIDDEPITITEEFTKFNYLDENIVETEERSSSPVIELFDVIASLGNKSPAHSIAVHQVTPPLCKANWHTTKSMLRLQSVDKAAIVRFNDLKKDRKISDSLIDEAMPLSCAANWLTTKFKLYLHGIQDALVRSHLFEYDKDISDNRVINEAMTLACEANWLTTKPTIHLQSINDMALVRSHVQYDDKMCNDRLVNQAIPLSCEVNWLTSKPMLHLQVVSDTALVRKEMPLSCEADWLTTKSMLYLQGVDNELARSNVIEFDTKICNGILDYNVTPLSCEAQWFATKVTLHLEVAHNALLVRSSISTNGNENRCDISSSSSDVILTEKIPIQTAPPSSGPSLVSLALESFRDANVIYQYRLLRKAGTRSPIHLLKRKSLSLQGSTASKFLKLNVTSESKFIDRNKLPTVAIDTPASDFEKVSGHILQDTQTVSHLGSCSEDITVKSSVCATTCDDIYNLNIPVNGEEKVPDVDSCRNKDVEATAIDSNTNIGNVNENYALSESSNINEENVFSPSEDRPESPVIDTNVLIGFENYAAIQFDEHSSNDSPPLSPSIAVAQSQQRGTGSDSCNNASEPSLETENILDKQEDISDINDSSLICKSVEAKKSENDSLEAECSIVSSTQEIAMHANESSDSGDIDDIQVIAIDTPALDLEKVSGRILQDTQMVSHLESSSEDKSVKSSVCATTCDDNCNLNVPLKGEEKVPYVDSCRKKDVGATAIDSNSNIGNVNENHALSESSNINEENVISPSEDRPQSPVIDTNVLIAFENYAAIQFDEHSSNDSPPLSPSIAVAQSQQWGTGSDSCNNASEPSLETENILDKQEDINDIDDSSLISTSVVAEKSENDSLKAQCSIVSSTHEIEMHTNESSDSGDFDDIQVKLAEIVGEPIDDNNTIKPQNNKMVNISEGKSEIIRIVFGDELFVNTDSKNIEISVSQEEQTDADILADEYLNTNDHEYCTRFGIAHTLDVTDEDNHEVVYVSTDDVMFLSETNSIKELDEEIVDMRSDEIVDDFLYDTTTNINSGESNLRQLSDQVSGSVNMVAYLPTTTYENRISQAEVKEDHDDALRKEKLIKCLEPTEDLIEATYENCISQVAVNEDHDDALRKANQKKCQEATEDLIENSVVATKGSVNMQDKVTKLFKDVTAESIMSKYLALIRNKSKMLESVVEYEDPEAGTCYVFPIIEELPHTDKPTENTEVVTSITESAKIREKANTVNVCSSRQNYSSSRPKEANKHNGLSYDDIEAKLAEIVGEPFAENKSEKTSIPKICLDEKYNTTYIVEVEAVSSPEKGVEDVACQLKGTDDQVNQKTLVKSLEVKSISVANKKRQSKYYDKSKDVSNTVTVTENLKVKRLKHTYAQDAEQMKTRRKSLKRKMDMPDTKTSERKYQKGNQPRLGEIVGESFTENESNKTTTHNIRLDEKYKTSYSVEVEAIINPEKDEDVVCQLRKNDDQDSQKTLVKSLKAKSIFVASKKRELKYHLKSKDLVNIGDTENLEVKLPKYTYSKVAGQINTRQRSLKRKMDMPETKTSERKYRKGKNIDYPRFTAAALSETVYAKEYKGLIDYCSSVKFSFAVPFHKEDIDVYDKLKSWPIENTHPQTIEQSVETNEILFTEIEKSEALLDPLQQTLPEEIISIFNENSYTPSNIPETNFNMGFGERSGRVIQESKDGEYTKFSAATLSDVKQLQPLLPSDEKVTLMRTNCIDNKVHDQKLKAMRFVNHLNLRDKVRLFFEKTKAELSFDWKQNHKKDDFENDSDNWPFGVLTSTRSFRPSPVEITVNVVQLGQLPVSTAAQNPITCDPRVTHVSNVSPSQCSPGNNLVDELQTPIKTEYTELTTANITLPMMQEYVQHHSVPTELQEPTNLYGANDSTSLSTQIKSIVKIELMEETSQETVDYENNGMQQVPNGNVSNTVQYQFENIANNVATESSLISAAKSLKTPNTAATFTEDKNNDMVEKPDQLAHAMNAAGITTKGLTNMNNSIDIMQQNAPPNVVITSQANTENFSKSTPISAIALQQAFTQILPPLNQTNTSENNSQTATNPQVLHIVQGNHPQSVINKSNGTQLLHIVQNKSSVNNGTPTSQQNAFSGLSLVDGGIQQSGNQLLHIVNTANQKNTNAGQLLKRVNLLTNLANVQGTNEQKMVQFVCKSADGKSIQLPHQRSMVLRLQPLDPSNVPTIPKQNENQDLGPASGTTHSVNEKESSPQEMKSRSLYEENYAKFVQNDPKFAQNGDTNPEKATSLPKFNQVFGKQVYQDKQNDSANLPENPEPPEQNNAPLEQINDITNSPMLIRKTNPTQPAQVQPNLVQQIKQTIGPMNIQTMHGGVIYTRQIPVNIGNGQTINLITVPSTELVDDSAQKQQTDVKFGNQEGDPPIIKIVPTTQPVPTSNGSMDDNAPIRSTNDVNPQPNSQPQPVLTQMRIKLPMLSKAPQMVGGTRVVRPSFFQIQRNVIGGANQQVYQQLVLTAAPPLGQSIRLPAQVQKPKTPSETQSSPESQMSSSTLEQLREFDMVLEQVKERSTVQPGSSTSANNLTKLKSSPNTTDAPTPSTSTRESPTQVLYSVGNTQPLNMVNYVSRKSTITSTTTSSFVRSPDSASTIGSPPSSTHSHLPHTVTSDSCASSCASEAAASTAVQSKPKKKKPKPSTSNTNPFNIKNTPKPSSQKPLEDEQTTQRILYILAEYKEQVENSPDKDKPAPRRRNNPAAPNSGSSKRKKSGSRRRDMSPVLGEDSCRTMGSEDSSCGTSLGECNECLETHSPEESPKKVVRRLTFEQETQVTQTLTTTTTTIPQRNVIVTDGQAFAVRGAPGKPATTVLMPANYLLPVSMVKGGQQIAIVTNRGPKLLVGAGEAGTGGTLLFQRLIGPGGLKPMLARPGVRHIRLPTTALHNLQAFNIATPVAANVQPPDSIASPAQAPTPPDLVDTRAMSSPWPDRDVGEAKPERGNSSPEGSEPWNLPSSSIADDYGYEEIVRTDNMDRTVLDAIPDRYSPDLEAQRIFDKMFDSDSKKSMYDSRCGYDIDASDDDKAYHQVVHRKDGRHTRLTHVSAAALRHKYAILEHELRLQKSLSEECEDLGVDSPSASELFPEAELLFAPSPAHEQTIEQCHTPQPTIHAQGIPQPDLDDQIATDHLLTHRERHDDLDINLDDVGEIVTVGEDGMTTIPLDHEEFARSHEEFARSHPNTTFHSEPEDGEVPPFTIAQGVKGRQITFHSRGIPATVVMAPQTTVISQATVQATGTQNPVKFSDIDNMINAMPNQQQAHINMPSVLKENNESLTKFDRLLNESRELNLSNSASAIVHSIGNGTQVIRRVQYERRDSRYLVEEDAMIAGDSKTDERRDMMDDTSSSERHPELFWDTQSRHERRRFDFSSDSDKCCKSPYEETTSDSSGIGAHMRLDSVIKAARTERRRSDGSSAEDSHPPLRTYPPKRTHQHTHHAHHHDVDRSLTGKTRASDRCHDVKDEGRRRASNRGVVKRGCHCCNGSTPPKPKKARPKKTSDYPHN